MPVRSGNDVKVRHAILAGARHHEAGQRAHGRIARPYARVWVVRGTERPAADAGFGVVVAARRQQRSRNRKHAGGGIALPVPDKGALSREELVVSAECSVFVHSDEMGRGAPLRRRPRPRGPPRPPGPRVLARRALARRALAPVSPAPAPSRAGTPRRPPPPKFHPHTFLSRPHFAMPLNRWCTRA